MTYRLILLITHPDEPGVPVGALLRNDDGTVEPVPHSERPAVCSAWRSTIERVRARILTLTDFDTLPDMGTWVKLGPVFPVVPDPVGFVRDMIGTEAPLRREMLVRALHIEMIDLFAESPELARAAHFVRIGPCEVSCKGSERLARLLFDFADDAVWHDRHSGDVES